MPVTAAAGFIASHLVDHLLAERYEVHGIDPRDPDRWLVNLAATPVYPV